MYYKSGDFDLSVGREEIIILIHYASLIDALLAEKLYYACETEYIYLSDHKLPVDEITYEDSHQPYWDILSLRLIQDFIVKQLIPALEAEPVNDIIEILGGWEKLKKDIGQNGFHKNRLGLISPQEEIFDELFNYIYYCTALADMISNALAVNHPYNIDYSDS